MTEPFADREAQAERARRVYRRFAPSYDVFRSLWSVWTRPIENELDRLFAERVGPATRVLELAPGTGINIARLFRCSPGFRSYLGIDASEDMLAKARPLARGDERVHLRIGDATDLAAVGGPFEFVVSTWLLSHLDAPAETVRAALGKLAPGGTAVFVFFTPPRSRLLGRIVRALEGPFAFRLVDPEPIGRLPGRVDQRSGAHGMATLVTFRAPEAAPRA